MRTLAMVLAIVALCGGACSTERDAKAEYLAVYGTFRDTVQASAVEGRPVPAFASLVGDATSTFNHDLEAIPFPDAAATSVEKLRSEASSLLQQCADASRITDPATMPVALLGITEQARVVRIAAAAVAADLGMAPDLGLAPVLGTTIGTSGQQVTRTDSCGADKGWTCESLIGDVVTDALRDARDTDFALMNSGGIRADLTCPASDIDSDHCPSFSPPPYPITRGQVNAALPFGNLAVVATIDGATLKAILENGVSQMPTADFRYPQVSGLCFTFDIEAVAGSRVRGAVRQAADGSCSGAVIDLSASSAYTLATNNYVVAGGDSYPVMTEVLMSGPLDQIVADWLASAPALSPAVQGRAACADPNPGSGNDCPVRVPG